MSPGELRRRADEKLAAAGLLVHDAERLRLQAEALTGLLDPLVSISQRVWNGPAAIDFEANCRVRSRQVDEQALQIGRIAGEFDEQASVLRREAASLQRDAVAAETAANGSAIAGGVIW